MLKKILIWLDPDPIFTVLRFMCTLLKKLFNIVGSDHSENAYPDLTVFGNAEQLNVIRNTVEKCWRKLKILVGFYALNLEYAP